MSAGDVSGLVIRPGDHVLVALHDVPDDAHAAKLADGLDERFPDVAFTVLRGVAALAVYREDDA